VPEPHRILTRDEFVQLLERGVAPPADALLRKQHVSEEIRQVGDDPRARQIVISSAAVDRDSDSLAVEGWELANYRRNPVVQWAHDYKALPVARATKVWTEGGKLKAIDSFAPRDLYPFADTVLQMIDARFLNAASVGFRPLKFARIEGDPERPGGVDFVRQELLEHSIVPVPSNPEALVEARSFLKGADWLAYRQELERLLDLDDDETGIVERGWRAVSPRGVRGSRAHLDRHPTREELDAEDRAARERRRTHEVRRELDALLGPFMRSPIDEALALLEAQPQLVADALTACVEREIARALRVATGGLPDD